MRVVTPHQIRRIDSIAIKTHGIASVTLMENAGGAVAAVAKEILNSIKKKKICIFCGKGNNGGDGLVAARHLINNRLKVDTYILGNESNIKGDAAFNLKLLKHNGCKINKIINFSDLKKFINKFNYGLVIDAIFGTGFSGSHITEPIRSLISFLNRIKCKIISVDIPSGLNGSTGKVADVAIRSDITVTLGLPKKGFFLNEGRRCTGKLVIKNVGFPKTLLRLARYKNL